MAYDKVFRVDEWVGQNASELRRAWYTATELCRVVKRNLGVEVSLPTVRTIAARHNVGLNRKAQNDVGPWIKARVAAGADFSGLTAKEIAAECAAGIGRTVSQAGVRWWLKELAIPFKTAKGAGSEASERRVVREARVIAKRRDQAAQAEALADLLAIAKRQAELNDSFQRGFSLVEATLHAIGLRLDALDAKLAPHPVPASAPDDWDSI